MTEQTSFSTDDEALAASIDGRLATDRADALGARLETIVSRLARARSELAELIAERASGKKS